MPSILSWLYQEEKNTARRPQDVELLSASPRGMTRIMRTCCRRRTAVTRHNLVMSSRCRPSWCRVLMSSPRQARAATSVDHPVPAHPVKLSSGLVPDTQLFSRVVHQSVETVGKEFYEYLRRRVWVTPMSYLELLGSFKRQLSIKRAEVGRNRSRLQVCGRPLVHCVCMFLRNHVNETSYIVLLITTQVTQHSGSERLNLGVETAVRLTFSGGPRQAEQHQGRGGDSTRGADRPAAAAREDHERGILVGHFWVTWGPTRTCFVSVFRS